MSSPSHGTPQLHPPRRLPRINAASCHRPDSSLLALSPSSPLPLFSSPSYVFASPSAARPTRLRIDAACPSAPILRCRFSRPERRPSRLWPAHRSARSLDGAERIDRRLTAATVHPQKSSGTLTRRPCNCAVALPRSPSISGQAHTVPDRSRSVARRTAIARQSAGTAAPDAGRGRQPSGSASTTHRCFPAEFLAPGSSTGVQRESAGHRSGSLSCWATPYPML